MQILQRCGLCYSYCALRNCEIYRLWGWHPKHVCRNFCNSPNIANYYYTAPWDTFGIVPSSGLRLLLLHTLPAHAREAFYWRRDSATWHLSFYGNFSAQMPCHVIYNVYLSKLSCKNAAFKETVSRDFRPLVFFINQLHLGPWLTP
jgi:hypothetical protein